MEQFLVGSPCPLGFFARVLLFVKPSDNNPLFATCAVL